MNKITAAITGVQGYVPEHVLSSTAAAPGAKTALNPAASWPFPTGGRP